MSYTALFDVGERIPRPRKDPCEQGAVETVIDEACRALHLPTIRSRWEDIAATSLKERASYKDFLADLLEAECADREERRKIRLVREANFPRTAGGLRLYRQPQPHPRTGPHPGRSGLGHRRAAAVSDRGLRHRIC